MKRVRCGLVLLVCLCSSPAAAGEAPEPFGKAGQRAVFGALGGWLRLGKQASEVKHDLQFSASPGLWLFVLDNFALGAAVQASYGDNELTPFAYSEAGLSADLGCGLNIPFKSSFSLFPRLWLGLGWMTLTERVLAAPSSDGFADPNFTLETRRQTKHGLYGSAALQAPLHFQLAATTYFEVGPFASLVLASEELEDRVRFGLTLGIGSVF